jgi:hypothetical protein
MKEKCCAMQGGKQCEQDAEFAVFGSDPYQVSYFCADDVGRYKCEEERAEGLGPHPAKGGE